METAEFADDLAREGFTEVVTVERPPHGFLDDHAHPFEAKAMILEGEIHLRTGSAEQVFGPGDVFHLAAGQLHAERYGPEGVRYLVGRKDGSAS